MLFGIGFWEWVVILSILLLLFGAGRVSKIAEDLGKSFSAFKQGMKNADKSKKENNKKIKSKNNKK